MIVSYLPGPPYLAANERNHAENARYPLLPLFVSVSKDSFFCDGSKRITHFLFDGGHPDLHSSLHRHRRSELKNFPFAGAHPQDLFAAPSE